MINIKLHKLYFFLILSVSTYSFSQELDENFLSSLPDEVKQDLLEKADKRKELDEPIYRNESSKIEIEKESLNIFGENFFTTYQSSFMPINEPNFDSTYTLDYGDVLKIQITGQQNSIDNYKVSRSGSINLPSIGIISVSGLSLIEASNLIKTKVMNAYIGAEAFISLENVRDINVMVAGNVSKPGVYTLSGNSSGLQALVMAGGVNKYGSYRDIKVIRDNKVIQNIDVYDYLIFAKTSNHLRLKSGDFIFVESSKNRVLVDGSVKRPMTYEMKQDETLADALYFSNGIDVNANIKNITLDTIENGQIKRINIDNIDDLSNFLAKDMDNLNISGFKFKTVLIEGAVKNPGKYLMNENDGIYELIQRAGGYSKSAYPFGAILNNIKAEEINQFAKEKLYDDLLILLLNQKTSFSDQTDTLSLVELVNTLKNSNVSGRVRAEFDIEKLKKLPNKNTILEEGDEIIIPKLPNHIYVYGEVSNPGTVNFDESLDIYQYLELQGGLLSSADKNEIYILLPNGESKKLNTRNKIFMSNSNANKIKIYPGSIIFVPRKIDNKLYRTQAIQAYATILGNIGVSLASLSVLKD